MPLTPADVHNIAFQKPPIGKRGYDQEQVDAYLDELEQELIRLIEENNEMRNLVARRGAADEAAVDPTLTTALGELTARIDRVRREKATVERSAREMRAELEQARRPVGGPLAAAEGEQSSRVLAMAERTAGTYVGEARREAHDLLSDAHSTARQIGGEALAKADALERHARQRHNEATGGLEENRAAAQQQIDDLEALEREYRSRLAAHVERQLSDLNGRARSVTAETSDRFGGDSDDAVAAVPVTDPQHP
jgi:DivIVA domain-containing protein